MYNFPFQIKPFRMSHLITTFIVFISKILLTFMKLPLQGFVLQCMNYERSFKTEASVAPKIELFHCDKMT